MSISAAQVRGARAMLNMTQDELAVKSGLKRVAIARFETGMTTPHANTLDRVQAALEAGGAIFIESDASVGVMVRSEI